MKVRVRMGPHTDIEFNCVCQVSCSTKELKGTFEENGAPLLPRDVVHSFHFTAKQLPRSDLALKFIHRREKTCYLDFAAFPSWTSFVHTFEENYSFFRFKNGSCFFFSISLRILVGKRNCLPCPGVVAEWLWGSRLILIRGIRVYNVRNSVSLRPFLPFSASTPEQRHWDRDSNPCQYLPMSSSRLTSIPSILVYKLTVAAMIQLTVWPAFDAVLSALR